MFYFYLLSPGHFCRKRFSFRIVYHVVEHLQQRQANRRRYNKSSTTGNTCLLVAVSATSAGGASFSHPASAHKGPILRSICPSVEKVLFSSVDIAFCKQVTSSWYLGYTHGCFPSRAQCKRGSPTNRISHKSHKDAQDHIRLE